MRYQNQIIRIACACFLALAGSTANAQRIRLPDWSPERPDNAVENATSSADAIRIADGEDSVLSASEPGELGSDFEINIDLPGEPRVASLDGPASLGTRELAIADSFVNLDACPTCPPPRGLRFGVFLTGLYLRPGGTNVVYAVEQTGCDPVLSSPTGQVGQTSLDRQAGARIGGSFFLRTGGEIVATYTWLSSDTQSNIAAQAGTVLASQVTHPSLANCGTNSLSALARQDIELQLVDLDYRAPAWFDCFTEVRYLAGLRYAHLDQQFAAEQLTGVATGLSTVGTDVSFDGLGIRLGLEGEQRSPSTGLFFYGRGVANLLSGEFKSRYSQVNQFGGTVPISVNSEEYRIVSLLETELGVGWQSCNGRWRVTGGYQVNAWFNTVTTRDYVRGVRAGVIDDLSDTITFDGLVAQVEWRR